MWYTSGSGRIELKITMSQAQACTHPGQCDSDVMALSKHPYIKKQLAKLDREVVARELKEYGAWSPEELADHDQNLQRILWIACGDIVEENR